MSNHQLHPAVWVAVALCATCSALSILSYCVRGAFRTRKGDVEANTSTSDRVNPGATNPNKPASMSHGQDGTRDEEPIPLTQVLVRSLRKEPTQDSQETAILLPAPPYSPKPLKTTLEERHDRLAIP